MSNETKIIKKRAWGGRKRKSLNSTIERASHEEKETQKKGNGAY